jgi:hypothetical protein
VITREIDVAIKESCRENWQGEINVDWLPLIKKIARDPPGVVVDQSRTPPKYYSDETTNDKQLAER